MSFRPLIAAFGLLMCASGVGPLLAQTPASSAPANPFAGLIDVKDTLFGTTAYGGTNGDGTIFTYRVK